MLDSAARSVRYALAHQLPSGAWPYGANDARTWSDNFHTGYILDCLSAYRRLGGETNLDGPIEHGWRYYRGQFFADDMTPKYYDTSAEPLDATACAQSIITLCEFGDVHAAARVAERSLKLLGLPDGSFAYQRRRGRTLSTPFLRWSSAWMYCALARLADELAGRSPALMHDPDARRAPSIRKAR
jgi:hypothetical protein